MQGQTIYILFDECCDSYVQDLGSPWFVTTELEKARDVAMGIGYGSCYIVPMELDTLNTEIITRIRLSISDHKIEREEVITLGAQLNG